MSKHHKYIVSFITVLFATTAIFMILNKQIESKIDPFSILTPKRSLKINSEYFITVKGKCLFEKREISGVLVLLKDKKSILRKKTLSNTKGEFSFGELPPNGEYVLEVYKDGFIPVKDLNINPSLKNNLLIELVKQTDITALITDIQGNPLSNAKVLFAGSGLWSPEEKITDSEGKVSFNNVPPGIYDILAFKNSLVGEINGMEIYKNQKTIIHLYLKKGVFLKGLVRDAKTGKPIENAEFSISSEQPGIIVRRVATQADGKFRIGPFIKGTYRFSLAAEKYVSLSGRRYWVDGKGLALFELLKGLTLKGTIQNDTGDDIQGATVEIWGTDDFGHLISPMVLGKSGIFNTGLLGYAPKHKTEGIDASGASVTNYKGKFTLTGIPPGWLALRVSAPGYSPVYKTLQYVTKNQKDIYIKLKKGKDFFGTVSDDMGIKVSYVEVNMDSPENPGFTQTVFSDKNGNFKLKNVPEKFVITLKHPYYPVYYETISNKNNKNFILKRGKAKVSLFFRDKQSINIEKALVTLKSISRPETYEAYTDKFGHVSFENLAEDSYEIILRHKDYPEFSTQISKTGEYEFSVSYGGGFSVFIRDSDTKDAIDNAYILLTNKKGSLKEGFTKKGETEFTTLEEGIWQAYVFKKGYAEFQTEIKIEEGSTPRNLTSGDKVWELSYAGSLTGIVRDNKRFPVKNAFVMCNNVSTKTNYDGVFNCKNLKPGEVKIRAWHRKYGEGKETSTVDKGLVTRDVIVDLIPFSEDKIKINIKLSKNRFKGITFISNWGKYSNFEKIFDKRWEVININGISASLPLPFLTKQFLASKNSSIYITLGISGIPLKTIFLNP